MPRPASVAAFRNSPIAVSRQVSPPDRTVTRALHNPDKKHRKGRTISDILQDTSQRHTAAAKATWRHLVNMQHAKTRLEQRRAELVERQERVARHTRHRDEPLSQDFAEQAVELENGETLVALDREISQELVHIDHALKRIEANVYASCERCAEPIGERRLEALPYASMCIDCASEA